MQKSPGRNALQGENNLIYVSKAHVWVRIKNSWEGGNCLRKIKEEGRKKGKKGGREGEREGKVPPKAPTLKSANPIPETECTGTSMSRWLQVFEQSLWVCFLLWRKPQEGWSLHRSCQLALLCFPPQPGTPGNVWLHFSKPQFHRKVPKPSLCKAQRCPGPS